MSPSVRIYAFLPRTSQACRQMWRYWRLHWNDIRKFWWRKSGRWSGKCSLLARRSSAKLQPYTRKSQNCLWFQTLFEHFQHFLGISSLPVPLHPLWVLCIGFITLGWSWRTVLLLWNSRKHCRMLLSMPRGKNGRSNFAAPNVERSWLAGSCRTWGQPFLAVLQFWWI